jgi:hypothetical protein
MGVCIAAAVQQMLSLLGFEALAIAVALAAG